MEIVLDKIKNNLRFVEAVRNDFDEDIFALIIEFRRELLYEESKKDHIVPRVGNIVLQDLFDDGNGIIEMVFLDDFEDENGSDLMQSDFINLDKTHLVFSVRGLNSDVLHVFHAVVDVGDVDLDDVLDGELLQDVSELEQARVLMVGDRVQKRRLVCGKGDGKGGFMFDEPSDFVVFIEQGHELFDVVCVFYEGGFFVECPLVHIHDKVFSHGDVDGTVFFYNGVVEEVFGELDEVDFFKEFGQVDEEWQAGVVLVAINFLFYGLHFGEDFVCFGSDLFLIGEMLDAVDLELVLNDSGHNVFKVVDDFLDGHVEFHFLEPFSLFIDPADNLELLHQFISLVDGNVLYVDEDLVDGDILVSAQGQFVLHGADEHFVDGEVGLVEFCLLVVHSVQQVFEV